MAQNIGKGIISGISAFFERLFSHGSMNPGMSITSDYQSSERILEQSFFIRFFSSRNARAGRLRLRNGFARMCENSVILNFLSGTVFKSVTACIKNLASFLVSYSFTASVTLFIISYLNGTVLDYTQLLWALFCCLISVPLLFSESSLYTLLSKGFFFRTVLFDMLFMPYDKSTADSPASPLKFYSFVLGIFAGLCVRHLHITVIPAVLLLIFVLSVILIYPETGFAMLVFAAPLISLSSYSSLLLASLVCFVLISYFFKLFKGRRVQYFTVETLVFFLLTFGVLLSSVSSDASSVKTALISCVMMSGYYLSVNLFRDENRLIKTSVMLSLASAIVSTNGIIQYIDGSAPFNWLDTDLFSAILGRTLSFFENPNMLGAYLTLSFPFCLLLCSLSDRRYRFTGFVSSLLTLVCGILSWSRGCWLGLLIGFIVYFLLLTPRSLLLIPASGISVTALGFIFPDTVGKRLLNFFSLSDSANRYRVRVWQGSFRALRDFLFTGIGSGDTVFRSVYLNYAVAAVEKAPHSHSIYMQTALSCGVITLLLFCAFILLLLKKTLSCSGTQVKSDAARIAFAAFSAVCATSICGLFDNVFYNYRVMFIFYCVCGLCSAASKIATASVITNEKITPEAVDITVTF